jgi:hypothetical protein
MVSRLSQRFAKLACCSTFVQSKSKGALCVVVISSCVTHVFHVSAGLYPATGESQWNKNKTFTGWADPDLTEQGTREVEHAARLLMEGGYRIDVVFTSRLKRAIRSVWILLQELNLVFMPVFKSWRLNERKLRRFVTTLGHVVGF